MRYDSIVIGSGLSGLTCALLLARIGRKVLVLEKHPAPAPVVSGFQRGGSYFDSGFHYVGGLGEGGAFQPLFRHLGLTERLKLFPFAERDFDQLRISATGETLALPVGFTAIKAELGKRFPGVRERIENYLDEVERRWCDFPYLDLDVDIADFAIESVHGQSLADRLAEFVDYPELQGLLSMHSLLYGIDPREASTTLNAQVAGSYYHSVHGIVGGGKALSEGLLALLNEAGAEVRCRAEVSQLLVSDGKIAGVRLENGEEVCATEVVATLNPTLLPQLLPEGVLRPAYLKRLHNLRQTSSAFILFGKVPRPIDVLRQRNLFVQPQAGVLCPAAELPLEQRSFYLAAADQGGRKEDNGVIGIVPARYAEVAEFADTNRRCSAGYKELKQQLTKRLLALFEESCPELSGLQPLELATPLTLHDYSTAPGGAIYGVGRYIGQYNPHPVTRLPGLYLSGQAIAAPGLLGTVVAAYLTCGSMLGHEKLRGELKACR